MYVLSLFDGMGCGWVALRELGIKVDKGYSSEIDKFAIKQVKLNFPEIIHLGSVTEWIMWDINWSEINLIMAGSPCQGFSFAGKQLAFDDPRSKLFFVFVEILNHCKKFNPDVKFLLENVDMKKDHLRIISEYVGIFPVKINSALVSAQNRERWYWTNIRVKKIGLFEELYTDIPQPEDKGILLRDILESDVMDKYYLSDKAIATAIRKSDIGINPKINPDKSGTVTCGNQSARFSIDNSTTLIVASRGRNHENLKSRESGMNTEQMLEPRYDGKTNCLISVQKDNLVFTKNYIQWDVSGKGYKSQQDRAFYDDTKHGTLSSSRSENKTGFFFENGTLRRLTPIECARLQTIPEWYRWDVSDSQIYRMLGNGWTVDIIAHIFSFLPKV